MFQNILGSTAAFSQQMDDAGGPSNGYSVQQSNRLAIYPNP
jgi:hypothetical protein